MNEARIKDLEIFLKKLPNKGFTEWFNNDKETVLGIFEILERQKHALVRLSQWPTKTTLQSAHDLILKARQVAKIGLGLKP